MKTGSFNKVCPGTYIWPLKGGFYIVHRHKHALWTLSVFDSGNIRTITSRETFSEIKHLVYTLTDQAKTTLPAAPIRAKKSASVASASI